MAKFNLSIVAVAIAVLNSLSCLGQEGKKPIKFGLGYTQVNDQLYELKATLKSKTGKKFEPVEGVEVEFFLSTRAAGNFLGKARTNKKGIASIEMPSASASKLVSLSPFTVIAYTPGTEAFDEQSSEIQITCANLEVKFGADNLRQIEATLSSINNGAWQPAPDTEVKFFVRRALSDLAIGEKAMATDSAGRASANFDFKTPLPGDRNGYVLVGAKVEDHDNFGTIVSMKYVKWGTPFVPDKAFSERSLWGSRDKTPIWLLVFPNLAIVIAWTLIFYMFYLIAAIRKIGLEK